MLVSSPAPLPALHRLAQPPAVDQDLLHAVSDLITVVYMQEPSL